MSIRRSRMSTSAPPVLFAAGATLLVLLWVSAALAMSGRGLDLTDEGFYLLSYRWWDSTPRTPSGVQYVYGPVFELLGYDIRALRIFRLATVLLAHSVFGWAFVTWLHARHPGYLPSTAWQWAAGGAIVASGGVTYGWLPLTPSYNDVAALASLSLVAAVLRMLRSVTLAGVLPLWPAVSAGPLIVVLLLAKWTAGVVAVVTVVCLVIVAGRALHARGAGSFTGLAVGSLMSALLVANIVVGGFDSMLPPLVEVNRLVAEHTNSPTLLLRLYIESGISLIGRSVLISLPVAPLLALSTYLFAKGVRTAARALAFAAPPAALLVVDLSSADVASGGAANLPTYAAGLIAMGLLVAAAAATGFQQRRAWAFSRERVADLAVVALLLGMPVAQAVGTGNPVYFLAVNQFASWVALLVVAVGACMGPVQRPLALSATACAVVLAAMVGFSGLINHPYRTASYAESTVPVGGTGPAAPVLVSPVEARRLAEVREFVSDRLRPGHPVMAFDELAGVVLVLDGRSVGEAWYSASDHERAAAGVQEACAQGNPWGTNQPIILFNRIPLSTEIRALASCGLNLVTDFRRFRVAGFVPALTIYLPVDERTVP